MCRALECREEKVVGKPYEGKPHVRFDVAGDGDQDKAELMRHRQTKEAATDRLDLRLRRHTLTLPFTAHHPRHPHLPSAGVAECLNIIRQRPNHPEKLMAHKIKKQKYPVTCDSFLEEANGLSRR